MTDKPNLADARRVTERFTPDSSPWWEKPTAFKVDTEPISAAVVPALLAAVDAVLALHVPQDPYRDGVHFTCKGCQTVATFTDYPCPTVRAIAAHLDIEPR